MQILWSWKEFGQLSLNELYEICAARQEVFVCEQKISYVDCDGKDLNAWHIQGRCRQTGELAAYLRILPPDSKHPYHMIGRVLTRQSWRGQGLGRALMQQCLTSFEQQLGARPLALAAQAQLQNFYRQFGFQSCSAPFYEEGILHVMMEKITKGPST